MTDWRYLAQDLVTGEWLHTNLPLVGVEIERAISAPGGINAFIQPEVLNLRTDSGELVLREWVTAIYAEQGNTIRGQGILTHSEAEDDGTKWNIECPGFTSYATGMAYSGDWSRWRPDPFDVVREIWRHLQSFDDGNIGMVVSDAMAGTGVGDRQPPPRPTTAAAAVKLPQKGARPVQGATEEEVDYLARVEAWEDAYVAAMAIYKAAKDETDTAAEELAAARAEWDSQFKQLEPYRLAFWEATDCGGEIDSLAGEVPFDYIEHHAWADATRQEIAHTLELAHPMVGRRRNDLRFAIGENIAVVPDVEHDGSEFANFVLGLGKGDGRKMLRKEVGQRDGRLRRMAVASFKDVGNDARLRALTELELRGRQTISGIEEIVVWNHPNAPLGSWSLGDEINISTVGHGWLQESMWVRIVSETVKPDDEDLIRLKVVNSGKVF